MADNHQDIKEQQGLNALHKLKVLDSPFETVFDTITRMASDICGTPMATITLMDEKRQWLESKVGLETINETPREITFCRYACEQDVLLEIPDATQDERFWHNPLVTANPYIRFYCGMPIKLPLGENIGSVCVIDTKPNYLNETQRKTIEGLAKLVAQLLVLREINLKKHT